jgi:hypothetical protein
MNKILDKVITERKGHYCHAVELGSAYELECCIEQLYSEFEEEFSKEDIIEFFETMDIYYYKEEGEEDSKEEEELYNFNIANFIEEII